MRSGSPVATDTDCIALAVALFQAPSQFPDLLHGQGELPCGVSRLLLIASGNTILEGEYRLAPFLKPEEIREAATFFIQQVLLAKEADHYRVLGVSPGAPIDDIKENHRLLMRLFHPDRHAVPDAEAIATATRVNQSYNVLRSTSARAAYDLTLEAKSQVSRKTAAPARAKPQPEHRQSTFSLPPFVARHLTPIAVGSVAMIASLSVLAVYLNRPTTGAIGTGDRGYSHAPAKDLAVPPRLPDAIASEIRHQVTLEASAPPLPATTLPVPERSVERSAPSETAPDPINALPLERIATAAPNRESARPGKEQPASVEIVTPADGAKFKPAVQPAAPTLVKVAVSATTAKSSPAPVAAVNAPAPTPATASPGLPEKSESDAPVAAGQVVAIAPVQAAPKPPAINQEQLNRLVTIFSKHYQDGNLETLLELFDGSARIERGDKKQIRSEYGDLFRNTDTRSLHVWDMKWSGNGGVTRGEGSFQARVIQKGDPSPRVYDGTVTFEVIERDNKPLIVGFYHRIHSN